MTALFEMRIRVGGDPRGRSQFEALRDELGKLSHPACPDVDWVKVEQLCLALFQHNGADLQSVCAYALARSQLQGVDGMVQGVALIESLAAEWSSLWPPMAALKLEILAWLFAQLQLLLRARETGVGSHRALMQLETELERLSLCLVSEAQGPLTALRQQVASLIQRLARSSVSVELTPQPLRLPEPLFVRPIVILPTPPLPEVKKSRFLFVFGLLVLMLALAGAGYRWVIPEGDNPLPEPVRLDSLALFEAASAELKPGSTKVLVNALMGIKAQPGWLIVIAGHTDATGADQQNLQLSHARAAAVRDWMQRMGDIADSCFAVQGFASSQPVASNDTEPGRAANRRVDIQLVPQVGACGQVTNGSET